ncbi:MAG: GNAT family N-acetyltransferase [Clostridia bacterium]|nr:GNAT family N-acetyltransferase [Clostridia bacterium]
MRIIPVTEENAPLAGAVHSVSWQASHRHFCPEEFVLRFDARRQTEYLLEGMRRGKQVWLLLDPEPAGLISLTETGEGSLIEDLYVLPQLEGRGYGGALLKAAIAQARGPVYLWILNNNVKALDYYQKRGFALSGREKPLSGSLSELEMRRKVDIG